METKSISYIKVDWQEIKEICEQGCDFQQCGILTSVDSEDPVLPPLKLRNSKCCSVGSLTVIEYSRDYFAKALIRLRVCAGWSESLLVAHTTLLEISCRGSIYI